MYYTPMCSLGIYFFYRPEMLSGCTVIVDNQVLCGLNVEEV